jgi:superfamily II DNA/RNA helicase
MFEKDTVIILPELRVKELQAQDFDLEDIIEKGIDKFGIPRDSFVYKSTDFKPEFIENLRTDVAILDNLIRQWVAITDQDPKLDEFVRLLDSDIFDPKLNPTGKLVVFSESKDTIAYLSEQLKKRLGRKDILAVSSDDRKKLFDDIQANFDANYRSQKDDYRIIISTDVLAEGVNLHRANIIVNYDTPWNATRLMQRIGRVNRIGSKAGLIINYMFYPSAEGDAQIRLYKNAVVKLQGFHSAFGEDSQIYSREEIVGQFELFNKDIDDNVDHTLALQREVRDLFANHPETYDKIKSLPYKSRTARSLAESGTLLKANTSLAYIASSFKKEFYLIKGNEVTDLGFLEAAEYFRATPDEPGYSVPEGHWAQISKAADKFDSDVTKMLDNDTKSSISGDKNTGLILKMLGELGRRAEGSYAENVKILQKYVEHGTYQRLTRELTRLVKQRKKDIESAVDYEGTIRQLVKKYHRSKTVSINEESDIAPRIIISESFIDLKVE